MNKIAFLQGYMCKLSEDDLVAAATENADDSVAGVVEGDNGVYSGKTNLEKVVESDMKNPDESSIYSRNSPSKQQRLTAAITGSAKEGTPQGMADSRTGE